MNEFNNVSDEQLACFIEDTLCEIDRDYILDAVACDDDMDILSIAYHANKLVDDDNVVSPIEIIDLPCWGNKLNTSSIRIPGGILSHQLMDCTFLADTDMSIDACCEETYDLDDNKII